MGASQVVVDHPDRIAVDAGVVDERVEPSRNGLDRRPGRVDARLVGDVELDRPDRLGLGDLAGIAGAGEDQKVVILGELARDLLADASIRPADKRDPAQILCLSRSFLPITIRWISEVPSPISSNGASR